MIPRRRRISIPLSSFNFGLCLALLTVLSSANDLRAQSSTGGEIIFRNSGPAVAYLGSKSCGTSGCHGDINRTYFPTPHGQSMAPANSPTELRRVPKPIPARTLRGSTSRLRAIWAWVSPCSSNLTSRSRLRCNSSGLSCGRISQLRTTITLWDIIYAGDN